MPAPPPGATAFSPCGDTPPEAVPGLVKAARQRAATKNQRAVKLQSILPCVHRGEEVAKVGCTTCLGNVQLAVFGCALFGNCLADINREGVRGCGDCGDRKPPDPPPALKPPRPVSAAPRVNYSPEHQWAWGSRGLLGAVDLVEGIAKEGAPLSGLAKTRLTDARDRLDRLLTEQPTSLPVGP